MDGSVLPLVIATLMVVAGVAGAVLPGLPGVPLVYAGLLVAAWADDFQRVGWVVLVLLGMLTALSFVIDLLAVSLGAKRVGATRLAVIGAAIGTFAGLLFGLPGLVLGPFFGAVIGELLSHGRAGQAGRVGFATWIGLLFGTLAKLALVFTMLGVFAAAWFL